MQECYAEPDESWLLTLALQGRLHRALHPKLQATRNICMHDFLKVHHTCDAYMGVQKERQSTFLTAFDVWISGKRGSQLVYCTILISQLSLNVFVNCTAPIYLYWLADFRFLPPMFQQWGDCAFCTLSLKRHTNNFAVVENISMWFCTSLTHR